MSSAEVPAESLGEGAQQRDAARRAANVAVVMLLLATVFWGTGFTWAKAAGETLNARAGLPQGAALGPVLLLAVRFSAAGLLWLAALPAARRGWRAGTVRRGVAIGLLLAAGLVAQHLGLDRTSEAVSAFLTNLTVIFVPLIVGGLSRRWPPPRLCGAIVLAAAGIYLMTGAVTRSFGVGEMLGLACSILFSVYIIAVDRLGEAGDADEPMRVTGLQFLMVGVVCFGACAVLPRGWGMVEALGVFGTERAVWWQAALLVLLPTVGAYGLMMRFQPRVGPTRAALIYLAEPVVAAAWAWWAVGRPLTPMAIAGAGMILAANLMAGKGRG